MSQGRFQTTVVSGFETRTPAVGTGVQRSAGREGLDWRYIPACPTPYENGAKPWTSVDRAMTRKSVLDVICWTLGGFVVAAVLSFFGILYFERQTATDGFALETAPGWAMLLAPFPGMIGLAIGCWIGVRRTKR